MLTDTYLNLFTDVGFKKWFGEEQNPFNRFSQYPAAKKTPHPNPAAQHYSKSEHLNSTPVDHKAIFDLRCVGQSGEHFIVEPNQNSLKFYATFPIQQQAQADE